jgi:hypothetical protein
VGLVFIIGYIASLQVSTQDAFHGNSIVTHDDTEPIHLDSSHHTPSTEKQRHSSSLTILDDPNTSKLIQSINQKYCGADQCRFLLPIAITEQGTFIIIIIITITI